MKFLVAIAALFFAIPFPQEAPPPARVLEPAASAVGARKDDVASEDAIVKAAYETISGAAGVARDWGRFRSLFASGARLEALGSTEGRFARRTLTVDDYVTRAGPFLEKNGFHEREIATRKERFGHLAHAFSTYESRHAADDATPFARGINSFQLAFDGERWWILSIIWDEESKSSPIPERYLPH